MLFQIILTRKFFCTMFAWIWDSFMLFHVILQLFKIRNLQSIISYNFWSIIWSSKFKFKCDILTKNWNLKMAESSKLPQSCPWNCCHIPHNENFSPSSEQISCVFVSGLAQKIAFRTCHMETFSLFQLGCGACPCDLPKRWMKESLSYQLAWHNMRHKVFNLNKRF